jgi:hypothetical protein
MEELTSPRSDSVQRFLERWYGKIDNGDRPTFVKVEEIPQELLNWHYLARSTGKDVTFQDYPADLTDLHKLNDGMTVIWIENQGTYHWAINLDTKDLKVFYQESASNEWRDTGENLSRFLLHFTVREAIIGAGFKFTAIVPDSPLQGALTAFSQLPFRPAANEDPSTRLLCSHNALARVSPPPVGYDIPGKQSWMITVAATSGIEIQEYAAGLAPYILPRTSRQQVHKASTEDLPF